MAGDMDERREALGDLPGEIRCPDEECDGGGDPRISHPQFHTQRWADEDGNGDAEDQTNDGVLDLEPDAQRDTQIDPIPGPPVDEKAEKPVQRDHPGGLVEGHCLEDPVRAEQIWRRNGGEQRDALKTQRAAKAADISAGGRNQETTQERWEHAKGPWTDPQEPGLQSTKKRDDRREVNISKRWMAAAGEIVELVGMEPEGAVGCEVNGNDAQRCSAEEKRSCSAGMLLGVLSVHAERHPRQASSRRRR